MRVAFIHYNLKKDPTIAELFLANKTAELSEFFLVKERIIDEQGQEVIPSEIVENFDVYALDPKIPYLKKENLYHYFENHGLRNLYGSSQILGFSDHGFLDPISSEIKDSGNIEKTLVDIWTSIPHPVSIKRRDLLSAEIFSVHELRLHALTHILHGEQVECVHQPKGQKITCTLLRNVRGKEVYTTPLFEKIKSVYGLKLTTFNVSDHEKNKIVRGLESFFSNHPAIPVLHVELVKNKKGIYVTHATSIGSLSKDLVPETLRAVGLTTTDVLNCCISHLSFKHL